MKKVFPHCHMEAIESQNADTLTAQGVGVFTVSPVKRHLILYALR